MAGRDGGEEATVGGGVILLGIDPGVRSGICYMIVNDKTVMLAHYADIPGGLNGFNEWWNGEPLVVDGEGVAHIIMEDFITREGKFGVDHTPERIIGAVTTLANQLRIPLTLRPPSGRLRQVPDEVLKRMGLHLPGKANRNAREAVRHCVAWLKAQKHPVVLRAFEEDNGPED